MVAILGIIQFIIIVYIFMYELQNKSVAVFLWATLLLMFGVMHLIASFIGDTSFSNAALCKASIFVICFCVIYILVRWIASASMGIQLRNNMSYENLRMEIEGVRNITLMLLVYLAITIARLGIYIKNSGGILMTSWTAQRTYHTSLSYLNYNQVLNVLFYSLGGIFVVLWIKKKYVPAILCMVVLTLNVVILRQRVEILPLICGFVTIYLIYMKRIGLRTIISIVFASIVVIFVIYGLRVIRYYGSLQNLISEFTVSSFLTRISLLLSTDDGELGLRRYFYYFISNDNNFYGFGEGATYIRMLFVFIPTKWSMGLKPDDFALTMGTAVGMASGGSVHPTLFGDCYANFGIFGVLLGAFWAVLVTFADKLIISRKKVVAKILLYVLWGSEFCIIGRGSVYNGFWNIAYGSLLIILSDYVVEKLNIPQISVVFGDKSFR